MPPPLFYSRLARPGQTVGHHLHEVAEMSGRLAAKIGFPALGRVIGLTHDLGKLSQAFATYMDLIVQGKSPRKGSVDHSTAGALLLWELMRDKMGFGLPARQIAAMCVAAHHGGGLMDVLSMPGRNELKRRLEKSDDETFYREVVQALPEDYSRMVEEVVNGGKLEDELSVFLSRFSPGSSELQPRFHLGMAARFLLSCLIDGDHRSASGDVPCGEEISDWEGYLEKLEDGLSNFDATGEIGRLRSRISQCCLDKGNLPQGQYLLTLPTGGGKTLASLRFALAHAARHKLDRIVYVIPYTSIIEQNAASIRKMLGDQAGTIVLEHHSNFMPDEGGEENSENDPNSEIYQRLIENWDAPIVLTTSVQFLNSLFASGASNVKRLHALARSVIIFDEIQTLPLHSVHLFNNAINFLTLHASTTAVFCTATQPCLDKVDGGKGALNLTENPHLVPDYATFFDAFDRLRKVHVDDRKLASACSLEEMSKLAYDEAVRHGSVLMVVNTKSLAVSVYEQLIEKEGCEVYHLSTSMCPAHRLEIIRNHIDKESLKGARESGRPVICVSTQLVEAGVDLDFDVVIRTVAGLDSITQAAGRCNRDGKRGRGRLILVNPERGLERLEALKLIDSARNKSLKLFDEFRENPDRFSNNMLGEQMLDEYFRYYFDDMKGDFSYNAQIDDSSVTLLDLLSVNQKGRSHAAAGEWNGHDYPLTQAFRSSGDHYRVIDDKTRGVIVPYGRGKEIIEELCRIFRDLKGAPPADWKPIKALLREAQKYSISIYENKVGQLCQERYLHSVDKFSSVFYLTKADYDDNISGCGFQYPRETRAASNTDLFSF